MKSLIVTLAVGCVILTAAPHAFASHFHVLHHVHNGLHHVRVKMHHGHMHMHNLVHHGHM